MIASSIVGNSDSNLLLIPNNPLARSNGTPILSLSALSENATPLTGGKVGSNVVQRYSAMPDFQYGIHQHSERYVIGAYPNFLSSPILTGWYPRDCDPYQ